MAKAPRHLAVSAAIVAGIFVGQRAGAAPARASISVERAVGAETCANEEELAALVEAAAGAKVTSGPEPRPVHLEVRIEPRGGGYRGLIELSGAASGSRTIEDEGPGCEVLSHALATTIAVLLDEAAGAEPPPKPSPELPRPPPPEEPLPGPQGTISVGATFDFGSLDGSAGGVLLSGEVVIPILSFGASFIALPYAPRERPASLVVYRLLGGRVRACTRQPYLEAFGASVCGGLLIAERYADSRDEGVTIDDERSVFLAAVLMFEVSRRIVGPMGLYADLGLAIPFFKKDLDVRAPAGNVLEAQDLPVVLQMGTGLRFWIGDSADKK